ncbi:hypothetical protein QEG73_04475 [Chitinophagaceae bacterium 26-R-25]|nr:hypothetical protein [Chitinophagaceae bacterium 26-R-25]
MAAKLSRSQGYSHVHMILKNRRGKQRINNGSINIVRQIFWRTKPKKGRILSMDIIKDNEV